jgi:hypothetical protein
MPFTLQQKLIIILSFFNLPPEITSEKKELAGLAL